MSRTDDALAIWKAALRQVDPRRAVREALREVEGPWRVIAVGKAAPAMVAGARDALGDRIVGGVLVHHVPAHDPVLLCLVGEHPLPGAGSLAAGRALMEEVAAHGRTTQVLGLWSGGASSLAELPTLPLDELVAGTQQQMAAGVDIAALNAWRTARSQLKGGKLRRASAGQWSNLVVSDVLGNDPALVGSGPGITDDAPGRVVLRLHDAVIGAEAEAWALRYATTVLSENVRGEAEEEGRRLAMAATLRLPGQPPMALIAAGEPVVTGLGEHPGGRMQHAALAAVPELAGTDTTLLCVSTDGRDGPTDAAGALVDGATLSRLEAAGIDVSRALAERDSYRALSAVGALVQGAPTGTNVGDLMIALS